MSAKSDKSTKGPMLAALSVVILAILVMCAYQLPITEVAVVTTLGKPSVVSTPGLHGRLPWPIQKVTRFDQRNQLLLGSTLETSTSDGINLVVQSFTIWRIADPLLFFNSVGSLEEATIIVKSQAASVQETVIRSHPLKAFLGASQIDDMEAQMVASIQDNAKSKYGIEIVSVNLSQLGLPERNTKSVFDRMRQDQLHAAAVIRSESAKDAKIIRDTASSQKAKRVADAEAEAKRIRGLALIEAAKQYEKFKQDPEFSLFLRKLDALSEATKTKTTIIIDPKTPPFDLLRSVDEPAPAK